MRHAVLVAVLVGCGLAGGCDPAPAGATVTGQVTVDGRPLAKGVITYVPADTTGRPVSAEVVDGRYEVATTAGPKKVMLSAPTVIARHRESSAPDAPMVEQTAESLPAKYHAETELTFDVKPGGNTKDWAVEIVRRR